MSDRFPSLDWTLDPESATLTCVLGTYKPLAKLGDAVAVARSLLDATHVRFDTHDWSRATATVSNLGTRYVVVVPRRVQLVAVPEREPDDETYGREAYEPRDMISALNWAFDRVLGPGR